MHVTYTHGVHVFVGEVRCVRENYWHLQVSESFTLLCQGGAFKMLASR